MNKHWFVALALCQGGAALAQDSGVSVSVGVRAWYTEWTTFNYITEPDGAGGTRNTGLRQVSATNKLVSIAILSVRYGDFSGSISAFPSTQYSFSDDSNGPRKEYDLNLGYAVLPGLSLTLGYKQVTQFGGENRYRPSGPLVGATGTAALSGAWSLYGTVGVGRLKTPAGDTVSYKANYRLTEAGLAYALDSDGLLAKRWTFTGGYRMQVMSSKDAFQGQDGQDTTQGFTLGVIATF